MRRSDNIKATNQKAPSLVSFDEDVENSSIQGQQARSTRGAMSTTMSDWDSNVGGEESVQGSAVSGGAVGASTPPRRRAGGMGRMLMTTGGGGVGGASSSDGIMDEAYLENELGNSTVAAVDDEYGAAKVDGKGSQRSTMRIFRWWSDVLSRVSRAASSILSQHSPNLDDILDGTGETPMGRPRRGLDSSIRLDGSVTNNRINDEQEKELMALREEVAMLKKKIRKMESEKEQVSTGDIEINPTPGGVEDNATMNIDDISSIPPVQTLRPDQISRYSRQLLLNDGFGVAGQKKLLSSSILVIGAGGIGSTVLLYLAAAGVGHITIVDYDSVEMSNLHRQVIHKDANAGKSHDQIGINKALSARKAMMDLNPTLSCTALSVMISADNALDLVSRHDVVVDACDNPQTRYLLNDACILAGKTLVSGSAMGTEGQLTVYNYQRISVESDNEPKERTACYRCLYPKPNAAEGCKSCSDNGVLGMVPGAIGILQAVETIKVLTGKGNVMHDRLLMYDSLNCSFLNIKKPPARSKCATCSEHATIKSMEDSELSLKHVRGPSVCAVTAPENLSEEQSISCVKYNELRRSDQRHILLDVRVPRQYEMCSLEGSINMPLEQLESKLEEVETLSGGELPVYCLCRRGIASATATRTIQQRMDDGKARGIKSVCNITGGLNSWVETVDSEFPRY